MPKDLSKILSNLREQSEEREVKVDTNTDAETAKEILRLHDQFARDELLRMQNQSGNDGHATTRVLSALEGLLTKTNKNVLTHFTHELKNSNSSIALDLTGYTGPILSAMVQTAYDKGENDFRLELEKPISHIFKNLRGTRQKPITIDVIGKVLWCTGIKTENIILKVYGPTNDQFGLKSLNSTFYMYSDTNQYDGLGHESRDCVFKSPHANLLDKLCEHAHNPKRILINTDGTEVPYNA